MWQYTSVPGRSALSPVATQSLLVIATKHVKLLKNKQTVLITYKHWHFSSGQVGGYFRQFSMHQPSLTVELSLATHTWDLLVYEYSGLLYFSEITNIQKDFT